MAQYIDADKFSERIKVSPAFRNINDGLLLQRVAIDLLNNMPTADVVPKSEYDAVVSAVDNSTKEFLKLHDAYQNARAEVVREIFEEIEKIFDGKKYVPYPLDALAELKKKYTKENTKNENQN